MGLLFTGALLTLLGMMLRPRGSTGEPSRDPARPAEPQPRFVDRIDASRFYRGNVHAHSARSDGDSSAATVIGWYRSHGYQFLALTDHNRILDPADYRDHERDEFVLLAGEEVTMAAVGKPIHVNAICTERTIGERKFNNRIHAVQWAVDEINKQGGVAIINHPNFLWALSTELIEPVRGAHLLDIMNGHPHVHADGDETRPSVEHIWDELLEGGSTLGPVAVDDMHQLNPEPTDGIPQSVPGTGFIEVFAPELSRPALCEALAKGRLYASTGPRLERLVVEGPELALWLDDATAKVEIVGSGGEVLAAAAPSPDEDGRLAVRYRLRGDEPFVRARITSASGRAWTNAFRTAL